MKFEIAKEPLNFRIMTSNVNVEHNIHHAHQWKFPLKNMVTKLGNKANLIGYICKQQKIIIT